MLPFLEGPDALVQGRQGGLSQNSEFATHPASGSLLTATDRGPWALDRGLLDNDERERAEVPEAFEHQIDSSERNATWRVDRP